MTKHSHLDFQAVTRLKGELHACLEDFLKALNGAGAQAKSSRYWPKVMAFAEQVHVRLLAIEEHWQFLSVHQGQFIIALVGSVNAGKSSLGNVLLGDDAAFPEAPVRETTSAAEGRLDEAALLIDLPGLGSVLAPDDDRIVRELARRADLLLLVMNISESISGHLYTFLQQWVCRQAREQQVIVVLNKVDALGDLPDAFLRREIERFSKFLLHGDQSLGFKGIAELFDYELAIVPFSVRDHRAGRGVARLQALLDLIEPVRASSRQAIPWRARRELARQLEELRSATTIWDEVCSLVRSEDRRIEKEAKRIVAEISKLMNHAAGRESKAFQSIWASYGLQLQQAERPNFIQSIAKGDSPEYQRKRRSMDDLRSRATQKYAETRSASIAQFRDDVSLVISAHLGVKKRLRVPSDKLVVEALHQLFYALWDHYDDIYFLDKLPNEASLQAAMGKASQTLDAAYSASADALGRALESLVQSAIEAASNKLSADRQIIKLLQPTVDTTARIRQRV